MQKEVFIVIIFWILYQPLFGQVDCTEANNHNILYYGLENEIKYVNSNYLCDSIIAFSKDAKISGERCVFYVFPLNHDYVLINFGLLKDKDTITVAKRLFIVNEIPYPKLALAGMVTGALNKNRIKVEKGISVHCEIKLQKTYIIKSYYMILIRNNIIILSNMFYTNRFDETAYEIFNNLDSGDRIIFINVETVDEKGNNVYIESSEFVVNE